MRKTTKRIAALVLSTVVAVTGLGTMLINVNANTIKNGDGSYSAYVNDQAFNDTTQWNYASINLPKAWTIFRNDVGLDVTSVASSIKQQLLVLYKANRKVLFQKVKVAVIDCGVQLNHPDLKGAIDTELSVDITQEGSGTNYKNGYKKLSACANSATNKGQYTGHHGTAVTSLIAAKSNNNSYGAGVASMGGTCLQNNMIQLIAIKADDSTDGRHITPKYLAKAINYAVLAGAEVINISYSEPKATYTKANAYSALESAVKKAIDKKVCIVAAAGNDSDCYTVRYPAGFPGVIGVGASYKDGRMASYSNESSAVDIVAPGGYENNAGYRIYTCSPTTIQADGCNYGNGTSYATPQVAGTVAMMKVLDHTYTPNQILSMLQKSSNTTAKNYYSNTGYSRFKILNSGNAVEAAYYRKFLS